MNRKPQKRKGPPEVTVSNRPQQELAAVFDASSIVLFAAKRAPDLSKFKPLQQVNLATADGGLAIQATGDDPSLLLDVPMSKPCIAKIIITAPVDTPFQLFYLVRGLTNYDESHSIMIPLKSGKNVIHCELSDADLAGALRLDPGAAPGKYVVESLEIRVITASQRR